MKRTIQSRPLHGFTLVELLVVIAIIGVLVALLLPAIQAAREAARRAHCQSNLKNVVLAVHNYASAHAGELPPGGVVKGYPFGPGANFESWSIMILPYLEHQALYDRYDFSAANDDKSNPDNVFVLQSNVEIYLCPSDEETDQLEIPYTWAGVDIPMARGSYRANTGRCKRNRNWDQPYDAKYLPSHWKGPFHATAKDARNATTIPKLKQITDGLSNTLFLGESTSRSSQAADSSLVEASRRRRTFWAYTYTSYNKSCVVPQTRTLLSDYGRCAEVGGSGGEDPCKRAWGSLHPGGLNFAFGDGNVRFITTAIDMEILAELSTMAGEELTNL